MYVFVFGGPGMAHSLYKGGAKQFRLNKWADLPTLSPKNGIDPCK
jgi:hypothetical protein